MYLVVFLVSFLSTITTHEPYGSLIGDNGTLYRVQTVGPPCRRCGKGFANCWFSCGLAQILPFF